MKKLLLAIALILTAFARDGTAQVIILGGSGSGSGGGTGCIPVGASLLIGDGAGGCGNAVSGVDYLATGPVTSSGLTQATGKILGRTTAGTGAIEEITVGGGLFLTSGVLAVSYGTGLSLSSGVLVVATGGVTNAMLGGGITNDKLAGGITYDKLVGTDITTVGTITTGTWQGSVIGGTYGGLGANAGAFTGVLKMTAGVASVVTGTGTNCVLVNGTSGSCGTTGGTVTSVSQTFTGGLISASGSPITTTGTLALTVAGTSGGIPYFASASTWASSAALTSGMPVLGGGAGNPPTVGSRSGNTTQFATITGTKTTGKQLAFDVDGNIVASATDIGGGGGGSGSINSGLSGKCAYYPATGTTIGAISGCSSDGTTVTLTSPIIGGVIKDLGGNTIFTFDGAGGVTIGSSPFITLANTGVTANRSLTIQDASGKLAFMSGSFADLDCIQASVSGGITTFTSAGAACGSGGGGSGDITAVVAGVGLTGGATSGSATLTLDLSTLVASQTIFDGSQSARTLTFAVTGTDPVMTFSASSVDLTTGVWKQAGTAVALQSRSISTTSPLGGGGDLSADRTLTCTTCVAATAVFAVDNAILRADSAARLAQASLPTLSDNGEYAVTLGANNLNGMDIKRNTDTSPTGTFLRGLTTAGAAIFSVSAVDGSISTGAAGTSGIIEMSGSTSGTISFKVQAIAGTYNMNWPTTAGTAGQVLTSQGGGANPMTWEDAGSGSGGISASRVKVSFTADITLLTNTISSAIAWNNDVITNALMHSTSTNNTRILIPSGKNHCSGVVQLNVNPSSASVVNLYVYKNGSGTYSGFAGSYAGSSDGGTARINIDDDFVGGTDYLEVKVNSINSGATVAAGTALSTFFMECHS